MSGDDGFLSRWSRRKEQAKRGEPLPAEAPPAAPPPAPTAQPLPAPVAPAPVAASAPPEPPLPTLDDVAKLTRDSDYRPFMRAGVEPGVRNAAMRKLFADPHFNVMDGLDVYIDDYGKPDPLPASMLRQLVQARALHLFDDERDTPGDGAGAPAGPQASTDGAALGPAPRSTTDEDPDLQLQPDDAAGPEGAGGGADAAGERRRADD